jgi:N-methylhydantoinase A
MAITGKTQHVLHLGVDIGGTFTDFVIYDSKNEELITFKKLSTPENPSQAVLDGLESILEEHEINFSEIVITHGSTVATNALLEGKGSRSALVTTKGFRDVIQIGRQDRPELYSLSVKPRPQLIPRELRFEVDERVNHLGEILVPLDPEDLSDLIAIIDHEKVEAIAVSLLFSFITPDHERSVAKMLRERGYFVSVSSEILPEYREYERTSTTVINAYVTPVLERYLGYLEDAFSTKTESFHLRIMQSNGGIIGLKEARQSGVRCILSGPAGGVVAASHLARIAEINTNNRASDSETSSNLNLITFDMGGTSTDVSLVDDVPVVTTESVVGGYPIRIPVLDIHTIGAGGGSIARVDEGGALRVGPESAGADPGPASYARGGSAYDLPTVTDANVVLGRLPSDHFLGGEMQLDRVRAQAALTRLGEDLGLNVVKAALGVIEVVNAHMVRAIRLVSLERGYDPQDFSLLSFGGAGGLHACELARQLGIPKVIIPPMASTLSAFGMLAADVIKDYSQTVMFSGGTPAEQILTAFKVLEQKGLLDIRNEGFDSEYIHLERALDMRYIGQSYELSIPYGENYLAEFHRTHEKVYGYARYESEVELVNLRVRAIGKIDPPSISPSPPGEVSPDHAFIENREIILDDEPELVPLYRGELLAHGNSFAGPAIIARKDTTVLLSKTDSLVVDHFGNLITSIIAG